MILSQFQTIGRDLFARGLVSSTSGNLSIRLGNRINLAPGKNVLEVEKKYLQTIPAEYMKDAHHLLILHGRYTCTARKPKCAQCCIEDLCEYQAKEFNPTMDKP